MDRFRKLLLVPAATALALSLAAAIAGAQSTEAEADASSRIDTLLTELAEPGREDWQRVESEIVRLWSRSGSEAMDMLLRRGQDAIEAEDLPGAVEHLTALTDHAPDFAEGWNARATAFFLMEEYALAIADIERVLGLNPRHFGALAGLGFILEAFGDDELALEAFTAARTLHPHRPEVNGAIDRAARKVGGAEL